MIFDGFTVVGFTVFAVMVGLMLALAWCKKYGSCK
jgi:hypothetical protein